MLSKFWKKNHFSKIFQFHPKFQVTKISKISKKLDKSIIFCKLEIEKKLKTLNISKRPNFKHFLFFFNFEKKKYMNFRIKKNIKFSTFLIVTKKNEIEIRKS